MHPLLLSPKTYSDIIPIARAAHILSWYRPTATLSLTIDDTHADRRTVLEVRIESGKCGLIDIRTLSGFDPIKNCWGAYCAPQGTIILPDRRGLKELKKYISEEATLVTSFPNPESFRRFTAEFFA